MSDDQPAGKTLVYELNPVPEMPEPQFPEGYGMRLMTEADVPSWQAVQQAAEPFFKVADTLFIEQFGKVPGQAWERCYLITGPDGEAVGGISAWLDDGEDGKPDGKPWGRLHWLAVHPDHQGKGLARAASVTVIRRLGNEFGRVFLDTQDERKGAIRLYESLGFKLREE